MTERTRSSLLLLLICFSFANLQFLSMWREIVLALLDGEIRSPRELRAWLDGHAR